MMEYTSGTHKAVLEEGGILNVYTLARKEVRVTSSNASGGIAVSIVDEEHASGSLKEVLVHANRSPAFTATYAGNREWNLDIDCGCLRKDCVLPTKELTAALSKCGFCAEVRRKLLTFCRKHKYDYSIRHY